MKINHIIDEAVSGKFLNPQATAQDPGLEREKDVDVIIFGRMPQDFTYNLLIEALEAVLPREYPPGTSQNTQGVPESPAERIGGEIAKRGGAVVTTKPLSTAQKLVKEFQARGIKCRIVQSGLDEDVKVPGPMRMNDYHDQADAIQEKLKQAIQTGNKQLIQQLSTQRDDLDAHVKTHGMMPEDITRRGFLQGAGAAAVAGGAGYQQGRVSVYEEKAAHALGGCEEILSRNLPNSVITNHQFKSQLGEYKWWANRLDTNLRTTDYYNYGKRNANSELENFGNKITDEELIKLFSKYVTRLRDSAPSISKTGIKEGTTGLPDPNNFDSDNDYYDAMDAYGQPPADDYEPMGSEGEPSDDWFDESREKIGNMDADAFDAALSRMKKLAGAGPLRTVYDPNKRVYKNVPHAVQPAQQPKKAR